MSVQPQALARERLHLAMHEALVALGNGMLAGQSNRSVSGEPSAQPRPPGDFIQLVLAEASRRLCHQWAIEEGWWVRRGEVSDEALLVEHPRRAPELFQDYFRVPGLGVTDPHVSLEPAVADKVDRCFSVVGSVARELAQLSAEAVPGEPGRAGWDWLVDAYETALQLVPQLSADGFSVQPGKANTSHARRSTGAYYTPTSLVEAVLDASLSRVVAESDNLPGPGGQGVLSLSIVDPACGAGRFLVEVAKRLTDMYFAAQGIQAPEQLSVRAYSAGYAEVVRSCIYGVDFNPVAVDWCRLSLWVAARDPDLPLSDFAPGIRVGNALLSAPQEFLQGLPPDVYKPVFDGDDKATAKRLRKRHTLAMSGESSPRRSGKDLLECQELRDLADAWCAAFFWNKQPGVWERAAPTHDQWLTWCSGFAPPESARERIRQIAREQRFFQWRMEFPNVFVNGGFDLVVGNPPWIAHAGRAAQFISPRLKNFYLTNYQSFRKYPTTHGMFVEQSARLLRPGGMLGLIVPSSISELSGYEGMRRAHDALCDFPYELTDFGEGQFSGVTQPCMALVSRRVVGGRPQQQGAPWPVQRPDLAPEAKALLERLASLPTLPPELFGERGIQSDRGLAGCFRASQRPVGGFQTPMREGADIQEFRLLPPRIHADWPALGKRGRATTDFQLVSVVLRQTAQFPVAALSDGLPFRNSVLAGFGSQEWDAPLLVALCNSALVRWHHFSRFRDARQPVLPQVKIGHLRCIPCPMALTRERRAALHSLTKECHERGRVDQAQRSMLNQLVADAYALSATERQLVTDWHRQFER